MIEIDVIYNADCVDGMRALPDGCIDLTVTSPPYDNLRMYKGYNFDFDATAQELLRVTKDGGVVVWVVNDQTIDGDESGTSFRQALHFKQIGFKLHDTMIYKKDSISYPETNRYYPMFEFMFVFCKGKIKTANLIADEINKQAGKLISGNERKPDGSVVPHSANAAGRRTKEKRIRGNVWEISAGWQKSTKDKAAYRHPAIFPEKLALDHIKTWSNPGDIVLDPFCGSGTTPKMAALSGRHYIGYEIDAEYCKLARDRVENANVAMLFPI